MDIIISHEARARYIERRKKDLETLNTALAEKNFSVVADIAHQLKGNGVTFGYPELTERAKILEETARSADSAGTQVQIAWIATWLKSELAKLSRN